MTLSIDGLVLSTHRSLDPLLPKIPMVDGLHCQDHATFVAARGDEEAFRDYWAARDLHAMDAIVPTTYPARHIAFAADPSNTAACEDMIGLSVSDDHTSPVNELVHRHGGHRVDETGAVTVGRLQHVALAVADGYDMADIRMALEALGVRFMTPILTFTDATGSGAYLQQSFVACTVPYGPFIEIIKRGTGSNGAPFQGFAADQIDTLYHYYDQHSRQLEVFV